MTDLTLAYSPGAGRAEDTPLFRAVAQRQMNEVKMLLAQGHNINQINKHNLA